MPDAKSGSRLRRQYDLVTAAYVLSELSDDKRQRTVRRCALV